MKNKDLAIKHMTDMLNSMNALSILWGEDNDKYNAVLQRLYPFNQSFDDLCTDVELWVEDARSKIIPQPETTTNVMPTFFWKDKSGRGETGTNTLQTIIDWTDEDENTSYDDEPLHEWAQCAEIGDTWENNSDQYTRVS